MGMMPIKHANVIKSISRFQGYKAADTPEMIIKKTCLYKIVSTTKTIGDQIEKVLLPLVFISLDQIK